MGMVSVTLIVIFALFQPLLLYSTPGLEEKFHEDCMAPFYCGKLGEIKAPYINTTRPDYCGPLVVDGCDEQVQKIQFGRVGRWYEVEGISQGPQGRIINIIDEELNRHLTDDSCESLNNLALPNRTYFPLHQITSNLTLFKCHCDVEVGSQSDFKYEPCDDFIICYNSGNTSSLPNPPHNKCPVQLPADKSKSHQDIFRLSTAKFSLEFTWDPCAWFGCEPQKGSRPSRLTPGLAIGLGGPALIFLGVLFVWHQYKRKKASQTLLSTNPSDLSNSDLEGGNAYFGETGDHQTIETFLRNYGPLASKRYTYSEVKKMTESFKDKIGQGGYGGVFKGKLPDGRLVAVKVLKESKSNGEEFINEVSSISRTSHVNIVTLLGFCFEGSKRALIYEFMSNGSLEKYIYGENRSRADYWLGWETLYQIAVGIARGLEYLHRGCNTRILHFDIKPHNILLDGNFFPKISDFGLAKICTRKESIVSMAVARGTVGYIAPEVFCRNFGEVSHKSDVYSYGMLVLEMAGGRKNICVGVDNTSEIYFPHWIHKRLQLGEQLELQGISNEEENRIARKLILASLWCIQTDPSNRPPMSEVVQMLQGRLESLTIPPKPYLSSPPRATHRSIENSSTTIITL